MNMTFFKWTSGRIVDSYALETAREFAKVCALPGSASGSDKNFEKKVERALAAIFEKVRAFRDEHGLGVFKRARFAKVFQDELIKAGYAPELVGRVTTALVTSALSGK